MPHVVAYVLVYQGIRHSIQPRCKVRKASGGLSWLHVDSPKVLCGPVEVRDMHGRPLVACCCDIMHAIVDTHLGDPTGHPKVRLRAHLDRSDG